VRSRPKAKKPIASDGSRKVTAQEHEAQVAEIDSRKEEEEKAKRATLERQLCLLSGDSLLGRACLREREFDAMVQKALALINSVDDEEVAKDAELRCCFLFFVCFRLLFYVLRAIFD
jgi:hypothetical protein